MTDRDMSEKELKKLGRGQLLELLLEQSKEIDRLKQELSEAKEQLDDRRIRMDKTGSIAEASLKLSGVFEAAQKAADIYLASMRMQQEETFAQIAEEERRAEQIRTQAEKDTAAMLQESTEKCRMQEAYSREKCDQLEKATAAKCEEMTAKAREEAAVYWAESKTKLEAFLDQYQGLRQMLAVNVEEKTCNDAD